MNFKTCMKFAVILCGLTLGTLETASARTDTERTAWLASHKISVPQGVKWQKRKVPCAIQKTLKKGAKVIKYGVADIGPQGATRWVLAWTTGALSKDGKSEIYISVFSSQRKRYLKSSERNVGSHFTKNIRLYWLRPQSLIGPTIYFGNASDSVGQQSYGLVELVTFPEGWQNQMFIQKFEWSHFYPSDEYFALPFVDEKGVLCVLRIWDYQDLNEIIRTEMVLHWDGKNWSQK